MVNALFMMKGYLVLKAQITIDKYHKYSITGLKPKVAGGHQLAIKKHDGGLGSKDSL